MEVTDLNDAIEKLNSQLEQNNQYKNSQIVSAQVFLLLVKRTERIKYFIQHNDDNFDTDSKDRSRHFTLTEAIQLLFEDKMDTNGGH